MNRIGPIHRMRRDAGLLKPGRNIFLYVGRAKNLRNRLMPSQHAMWDIINTDSFFTVDPNFHRLRIAAWYIDDDLERKMAEASLIKRLKPFLNIVDEGKADWQWRSPDVRSVDPLWIIPTARKEFGSEYGLECSDSLDRRPGIYGWYLRYEWWQDAAETSPAFQHHVNRVRARYAHARPGESSGDYLLVPELPPLEDEGDGA